MADPTFRIRGILPPDIGPDPAARLVFYGWVVEIGLAVKDRELARGLDRDGEPLRPISAKTRKHRRSAMTPDGKGDPKAPPLMPARALSRTRSLLAGRATPDAAVFYWRFDPFTGRSWGEVLAIHRRKGRDVIGISPAGLARVRALAWERWRRYKAGLPIPAPAARSASPGIPRVGSYSTGHATFGIGAAGPEKFKAGQWTGGMTWPEWRKYFTQPNPAPVAIPGRPAGPYNRLLAHTWGQQGGAHPPGPRPPAKPTRPDPAMFALPTRNPMRPTPGEPLPGYHPTDEQINAAFAAAKKKAPKPKAPPKPKPPPFPKAGDDFDVVKTLGGSTGAKLVKHKDTGNLYVLKKGGSPDHLREEGTADALYRAMGLDVPRSQVYDRPGGPVKLAEFHQGVTLGELKRTDPAAYAKAKEGLRKGFVADALLGNWDVIGMGEDNILVTPDGKVLRIDNGGSLRYRAQGARKSPTQFGDAVTELDSMRNPGINSAAASIFAGITDDEIRAQIKAIARKKAAILKAAPDELKGILDRRIEWLKDYGKPAKAVKVGSWKATPADRFRTFATTKEADQWTRSINYAEWAKNLTPAERSSIQNYKNSSYIAINDHFRNQGSATLPAKLKTDVEQIDEALRKHPTPEAMTTVRYFSLSSAGLDYSRVKLGMDLTDNGYTSTSVNPHHSWSGHRFEVRIPAGVPAGYVQAATPSHQGEFELLLGREASTFRVVELKKDKDRTIVVELVWPTKKGKNVKP